MTPIDYSDLPFPVRADFAEAHTAYWKRLSHAGSWWTAKERIAIAREVRNATDCLLCGERKTALSPYGVDGSHNSSSPELPSAAIDAVHRVSTDASRLTKDWLHGAVAEGLTDGHYIELLGTVVSVLSIDAFCRAVGAPLHSLPQPLDGRPDGYRPASANQEEAWLPVVPAENAGTPEADLWPSGHSAWVVRAMSLVPEEVRTLKMLSAAHYLPMKDVRDPTASRGSLTRPQIELIAGRVSALNECFY